MELCSQLADRGEMVCSGLLFRAGCCLDTSATLPDLISFRARLSFRASYVLIRTAEGLLGDTRCSATYETWHQHLPWTSSPNLASHSIRVHSPRDTGSIQNTDGPKPFVT